MCMIMKVEFPVEVKSQIPPDGFRGENGASY